jgi:hypothetical protein
VRKFEVKFGLVDTGLGANVGQLKFVALNVVDLNLAGLAALANEEVSAFDMADIAGVSFTDGDCIHGLAVSEEWYGERTGCIVV